MPAPAEPPVPRRASPVGTAKVSLREQVLAARRRRPVAESEAAAEAIAEHVLAWDVVRRAGTVAAYVAVGREPGTVRILEELVRDGTRVLLPVLRPDNDLDWVAFSGQLETAARGLLEPVGIRLGVAAVAGVDVVLVPGLAASGEGDRLGRGGGSYDRALARVGAGVPVAVLLHEDEKDLAVPAEPHDRRVTHVVTPAGVQPLSRSPMRPPAPPPPPLEPEAGATHS